MILVTGAAGNSGRMIVDRLARSGTPARALVRSEARREVLAGLPGVHTVAADMARPDTLGPALDGIDTVLLISTGDDRMAETQCAFVDAAKAAGVRRIVKFSGQESGIGFDPAAFRFTRMHEQIERHIEASGLAWTHLRPCQFMQVYLREAPSIARDGVLALAMGDIELAPVDLADVAAVAVAILRAPNVDGQSFFMTGPEALTMDAVAQRIGQAIGKPVRYQPLTLEQRRERLLALGTPPAFVDALDEQARERLRRPRSLIHLDTHARFGVPPTPFSEFARRHRALFGAA